MNLLSRVSFLLLLVSGIAAAQPRITGLQNNYSYLIPGTPNYAIARGSIVVLYGTGLAPAGLLQQDFSPALNRNLGGVSIKITVGTTTTEAIPYYVSPTQIAAILPSATPLGDGSVTATYNGQTSPAFSLTIVQSAFGILTLGGNGLGNAAVYDLDYKYITPTNAANPGQIVYFWGTGQGPDPNDETRIIAAPQNLAGLPFEFYIANKPAKVIYHGRSTYPGLDQIAVEIPDGVSGCYASAYAKTGNIMSNFVSIPVAATGRVCEDWFSSAAEVQQLLGTGKTEVNLGWFYLSKFLSYTPASGGQPARLVTQDSATAQFLRNTPFDSSNWGSVGGFSNPGCIVSVFRTQSPFVAPILKRLDAGPSVTLTLPDGATRNLAKQNVSDFAFSVSDSTPNAQLFIPSTGGTFKFKVAGGTDVGPTEATINANNPLVWNEHTTITSVSRSQPLTLTWKGGTPGGFVIIQGGAFAGPNAEVYTAFGCTERVEAGRYTVPRDVLASMVASSVLGGSPTGTLLVQHFTYPARFTATGLDHGSIVWQSYSSTNVHYQ
ncbi:MAG: IPT/TIG domain-containing protein [Bryobacteraceae bacterium]